MIRSLGSTAALILILAGVICGQSIQEHLSYDFVGGGARAEAMGNAYVALSDDITAGAWNPAGLMAHEGPMLGASFGSLTPSGYTNANMQWHVWRNDHSGSLRSVSGFNFLAPVRIKGRPVVGSISFTRSFEEFYSIAYNAVYEAPEYVYRNNLLVEEIFQVNRSTAGQLEGGVNIVTFAFGTRLYKELDLGIGVNIYGGETVSEDHILDVVDGYPLPIGSQEGRGTEDYLNIDTSKFSGTNFTVGLKWSGEKISTGLLVRTPFDLNRKQGLSLYRVRAFNGRPVEDGTDTTFFDNILIKYEMPLMVTAGVAYRARENFVLTADAEFRDFSGSKVRVRDSLKIDPEGNNEEFFTDIETGWNDVFVMRFGSEYVMDTKIGKIPLRAGLGFVPLPTPNKSDTKTPVMSYNFPHMIFLPFVKLFNNDDTPIRYTFSVGTGIQWSQIFLEWAYTYSTLSRDYQDDIVLAKIRNHHFGFTFTGYF
ncbi:MAG: outer membrane protein transport protein [candidate division Zixibacteria bacterium]|nr:outer membrane protein transport protein [candidate division Zixibacteria bacterium]